MPVIPIPLLAVIAEEMGGAYTHTEINSRFMRAGFSGDPPDGNKVQTCQAWLRAANHASADKALGMASKLIEEIMEVVPPTNPWVEVQHPTTAARERIEKQLAALGLTYVKGGYIVPLGTGITSETLEDFIRGRNLIGVKHEFERIIANIDSDPPAAVTAACALLESLFQSYIADENLLKPADQSLLSLWKVIRTHLGLSPSEYRHDSLKKIPSGVASTIDGIATFRTVAGSAHGRDVRPDELNGKRYKIAPRHARLATQSAMTLAVFFIESLDARR